MIEEASVEVSEDEVAVTGDAAEAVAEAAKMKKQSGFPAPSSVVWFRRQAASFQLPFMDVAVPGSG